MAISTTFFVLSCLFVGITLAQVAENRKVYIVYLGEKQHEDPELTKKSHNDMLANVVGSKELAAELMVHSYKHGFSGFAAKLTESEAQKITENPDVVHVTPNKMMKTQTTRSWDYMGLSSPMPNNLLGKGNEGDGIIIGVIDSGIFPESQSFNDEGLGPIPSRWKGTCVSGEEFDAAKHCNRKIIGAKYFMDGFLAECNAGGITNMTAVRGANKISPRDAKAHGTHIASTAAGSYAGNVSYKGLGGGTARGGAAKARIAVYKVCWNLPGGAGDGCSSADVAKAIDHAIHDGVDVIQISLGGAAYGPQEVDETYSQRDIYSLHAVAKGIPVVFAAGNDGSQPQTISNNEPWAVTVGASTIDREFLTRITLGDNSIYYGRGLYTEVDTGFKELYVIRTQRCADLKEIQDPTMVAGKVVMCFMKVGATNTSEGISEVIAMEVAGLIVATKHADVAQDFPFPYIEVDYDIGNQIFWYASYGSNVTVKVSPTKVLEGRKYGLTKIASFSSRGPNAYTPAILKPDISAPGVNILAAGAKGGYEFMSGTSMAAPHVSGIIALLKQSHPNWSPAALKSALMTTAWTTNRHGLPIFAQGLTPKVADAFDMGAGIVNPNGAFDPGLVYDMDINDYAHYFCAMGYNTTAILKITNQSCPAIKPSILDVNVPSITIPSLKNSTSLTRTVTNVGRKTSVYKAVIDAPKGTVISVRPNVLVFNAKKKKISFKVNVYSTYQGRSAYYNFGSLTWSDGVHAVRIPISVKTDVDLPADF